MPNLMDLATTKKTAPGDLVKSFIKVIRSLDTSKDNYTKIRDFLTLAYCAYSKRTAPPDLADKLEAEYMRVVGTYANKDDVRQMPALIAQVHQGVHSGMDFLGIVAGELELLNSDAGQFFTPYEVSKMMAMLTLGSVKAQIADVGYVTVQEPACGAGSMILAVADVLEQEGFDPGLTMWVEAIDVAEIPFKMAFLQLALRGVAGRVYRGNTLSGETFDMGALPACHRFLDKHGFPFTKSADETRVAAEDQKPVAQIGEQMVLF